MIEKHGKVIISEDNLQISEFHFNSPYKKHPSIDALLWAQKRIREEIKKENNRLAQINNAFMQEDAVNNPLIK